MPTSRLSRPITHPIYQFILLAALWGGSFSFMRILSPVLGTYGTSFIRSFLGASFLLLFLVKTQQIKPKAGIDLKHYFVVGLLNSAIPFILFNYAAHSLPSNISAILNSSTPFFGFVLGLSFLNERFSWRALAGIALGIIGVVVVRGGLNGQALALLPILACLCATCLYACAGVYSKHFLSKAEPLQIASFSLLSSALVLFPLALLIDAPSIDWQQATRINIVLSVLGIAGLCSSLAYVLYFRLISTWGPTKTVSVTFVIPIFGAMWGFLLLGETPTLNVLLGGVCVVAGTALILRR
jgi:drug/metabolite transporter (DMT)-like permease